MRSLDGGETMVGTDGLPAMRILEDEPTLKLIESSASLDMAFIRGTRRVDEPIGRWGECRQMLSWPCVCPPASPFRSRPTRAF